MVKTLLELKISMQTMKKLKTYARGPTFSLLTLGGKGEGTFVF
jgi:hypothetical protein